MNLRVFCYYTIDHPFKNDEKIIFSNRGEIAKIRNMVHEISQSPRTDRVRLIRVHISADRENREADTKRILDYEQIVAEKERLRFSKAKSDEIFRFSRALIIAYLLFLAPESFWSPIVSLFSLIAHGLSDYARWCIIAFFPIKAAIRTFGSLIYIKTPGGFPNIGIKGRWHRIHETAKTLGVYRRLNESIEVELNEEIEEFMMNLKRKESTGPLIEKIDYLLKNTLKSEDITETDRQFKQCISEGEKGPLWGEMIKMDMLRREILYFISIGGFHFSSIEHFYPGEEHPGNRFIPMADIKFQSFSSQSRKLREFNERRDIKDLKKSARENMDLLTKASNLEKRIGILEQLSFTFEKLRDEAGRYHMGQNLFIPNEKGNDLALFYHRLFHIFGSALCDLENKYKRTLLGIVPIRTERAQKIRIRKLTRDLEIYLEGKYKSNWANRIRKLRSLGGENPASGFAASFLILFLAASLFSIHIVNPGDQIIRSTLKMAYMGKFINKQTNVLQSDSLLSLPFTDKKIAWHLPRPLSKFNIIGNSEKALSVYMIMGEHHTDNPLKALLSQLSGQLGTQFDVIELEVKYSPLSAEKWSLYNSDGKGERRLLRDLSELAEEWKNRKSNEIDSISSSDFEQFFKELTDLGVIEDYLRRSFSLTTFSTNLHYGSLSERFDSGISAVLSEFEKIILQSESDPFMEVKKKVLLKEKLETATGIVEDLQQSINEQVSLEYSQLRGNPDILNQLVRDPFNNIQKLKDFETLWINISDYTRYLYKQKKILEILSSKEDLRALHREQMDLTEFLKSNGLVGDLIDIKSIQFRQKTIGLTEFTQYQEKWKNTI